MQSYKIGSVLAALGLSVMACSIVNKNSEEEIERIGLEAQEEINLHYANTVMTGLQDDAALQSTIDRYREVLPRGSQPLLLINKIEQTYPSVTGKRCMLQSNNAACRRYLEAVEPFIFK